MRNAYGLSTSNSFSIIQFIRMLSIPWSSHFYLTVNFACASVRENICVNVCVTLSNPLSYLRHSGILSATFQTISTRWTGQCLLPYTHSIVMRVAAFSSHDKQDTSSFGLDSTQHSSSPIWSEQWEILLNHSIWHQLRRQIINWAIIQRASTYFATEMSRFSLAINANYCFHKDRCGSES